MINNAGHGWPEQAPDSHVRLEEPVHTVEMENGSAAPDSQSEFWDSTETLRHVADFARSRLVSPWAMLGVSLARVVAAVPPSVKLPPLVGGHASLNMFVGLVGESGSGKGAVERAAADAFDFGDIFETGIGSGEGINHVYATYEKSTGSRRIRESALFSVAEIDSLAALSNRQSSTLLPQLRKAWSAEDLTFAYATKEKALQVLAHSYRMCLVAGIQPGRARFLLDDSDGGTPQRFLWMPTSDPTAPDEQPVEPPRLVVLNSWSEEDRVVGLPDEAINTVKRNQLAKLRGERAASELDGHLTLCRLKTAAALALLEGRQDVGLEDWQRAGQVTAVSQRTRASVEAHLVIASMKANTAKGKAEGLRAVASQDVQVDAATKRVAQWIIGKLRADGEMQQGDLRKKANSRDRKYFENGLARLVDAGEVEVVQVAKGKLVRTSHGPDLATRPSLSSVS